MASSARRELIFCRTIKFDHAIDTTLVNDDCVTILVVNV